MTPIVRRPGRWTSRRFVLAMRRGVWVAVLLLASGTSVADDALTCRQLAEQAMIALHQGEDAPTVGEKMVFYRAGRGLAERAVALDDENADAQFALFANTGRIMFYSGVVPNPFNLITLRRTLRRTLELNPNHAAALASRGSMSRRLPRILGGSLPDAEADLVRSLEIDPTSVSARLDLARTYAEEGCHDKALREALTAQSIAIASGKQRHQDEAAELLVELQSGD